MLFKDCRSNLLKKQSFIRVLLPIVISSYVFLNKKYSETNKFFRYKKY